MRNNRNKPGFFDYGGQLWVIFQAFMSLVFLNLLFLVGCLGVVTLGASLLALTEVTIERCRYGGEAFSIFKEFWKAYKRHLRRGIPLSIALILISASLVLDYMWIAAGQGLFPGLFGLLGAITLILTMILVYYLPLLTTGKYSLWEGVIAAFFESFSHWGLALADAAIVLVSILLCLYIPDILVAMIPVFLIVGFALVARILLSLIVDTLPGEDDGEDDEGEEES